MAAAGARQCVQPLLALLLLLSISNASGAAAAPPQEAAPAARALPAWVPTHGAITAVPGFGSASGGAAPPSRMYGGYVPVGRSKQLYYIMVESERDPANDPVVLWLNGGPGCSSFDGFVYEQGPFNFRMADDDGGRSSSGGGGASRVSLSANPFAWSKVATMVFLDSPSAVGLSFSLDAADYKTNDTQTARDSAEFLRGFFSRHPALQANDFYISGESYAGQYIPMLAREVVAGNDAGLAPHINIKGYAIGNGVTDDVTDGNAYVEFAASKSLIPQTLYRAIMAACNGSTWAPPPGSSCEGLVSAAWSLLDDLNIYNILEDCHTPGAEPGLHALEARRARIREARQSGVTGWPLRPVLHRQQQQQQPQQTFNWAQLLASSNPPCVTSREADTWLNDPAVRAALHAAPLERTGPWSLCSRRIRYSSDGGSMLPLHDWLVRQQGLRALIFSGDHDLAVPHTGTEAWTAAMHSSNASACATAHGSTAGARSACGDGAINAWQPWYNSKSPRQVAGYVVDYSSGLTYATIKGAGHMVPQTNPRDALDMFERWLGGHSLTLKPWPAHKDAAPTPAKTPPQ